MKLKELNRLVSVEISGCPAPTILNALKLSAIEFCEKTGVWKERLDVGTVSVGEDEIDLDSGEEGVIHNLLSVKLDGRNLRKHNSIPDGEESGTPNSYYQISPKKMILNKKPDKELYLTITATLKPKSNATKIPNFIGDEWGDTIARGAIARLKKMSKEWGDPIGARTDRREFNTHVGNAKARALGQAGRASRIKPRPLV